MNEGQKDILKVMKKVIKLVENLSDEELEDVVEGKKKVMLVEVGSTPKTKVIKEENVSTYLEKLEEMNSREEARKYIESLKWTKVKLKELAAKGSVYIGSKDSKEIIIQKIINHIVGARLTYEALNEKE